jgi:hypothetical protein
MHSQRWLGSGLAIVFGVLLVAACQKQPAPAAQATAAPPAGPAPGTLEWKMQNASSAAPAAIAGGATLMEWGATPTAAPAKLRDGTNGWTCFVDNPGTPGNDPMCFDNAFAAWATAWMGHKTPTITSFGVAYMLQGGTDASNTDPFKMAPDSGHPWVDTGPHVMVVVPNVQHLRGLSTDPKNGGPYVMWAGTPYAHVMVPVAAPGQPMAGMPGMAAR